MIYEGLAMGLLMATILLIPIIFAWKSLDIWKTKEIQTMSELEKLEKYLKEHNYNYKWNSVCLGHEGYPYQDQIIVYDDHNTRLWDAVCHFGSYGHEKGLLEIMGIIVNEEENGDSVVGWLTADDVIKRLEKGSGQ